MKLSTVLISLGLLTSVALCQSQESPRPASDQKPDDSFDWQGISKDKIAEWKERSYSETRWWGGFPKDVADSTNMFKDYPWAIGPITKYEDNPILAPTTGAWDQGHFSGGVHNGSILVKDGLFYYIYRGERPIDIKLETQTDYISDVGAATSKDGIHFTKVAGQSGFFRHGEDRKYSYEDVNLCKSGDLYYLFCNQWYWPKMNDCTVSGIFLATSKDLIEWKKIGIVFPTAKRTHRNGVVLQSPNNEAVKVNGRFVMYLDGGLMAYSSDMIHWESREIGNGPNFPGGEVAFALTDYDSHHPENIILFTGGSHSGHFYAIGEVLFNKDNPEKPLAYLPRPALAANPKIPYENGFSVEAPYKMISSWADTIFVCGMTRYNEKWWFYYGGSEYYTCLANAPAKE
jgi:predicted GH43/DUF377 family glycosyl hydrolase